MMKRSAADEASVVRALVVVAAGQPEVVATVLQRACPSLAALLGGLVTNPLDAKTPDQALAALVQNPAVLAPLPRDPGHPLDDGRHWAAVLGAWRQPTVVVIPPDQLDSGMPAASTALLHQWQVPCLGLVQLGGRWDPARRRREGLPWLGCLDPDGGADEANAALRELLRRRQSGLTV